MSGPLISFGSTTAPGRAAHFELLAQSAYFVAARTRIARASLGSARRARFPRSSQLPESVSVASMAITEAHAGRRYPACDPYQVSAAKIAEFATALGDDNPRYRDDSPIAPPTFAAVISAQAWNQLFSDPELELAVERIVHGDQRFTFHRPFRAGDVVIATVTIDKVRCAQGRSSFRPQWACQAAMASRSVPRTPPSTTPGRHW